MESNQEVDQYIEKAIPEQKEILEALRQLIQNAVPNATEQYKWSRPVYATEKDFCYLVTTKNYVTLGFNNFTKINGTKGLLEGTGKTMRHIKIHTIDDVDTTLFTQMIKEAAVF